MPDAFLFWALVWSGGFALGNRVQEPPRRLSPRTARALQQSLPWS